MKFEEKLIKLRREHALSQEELGEKLNVTRQTISKWELGQTKPDSGKIMELAKLFNISTDELLNESDETQFNNDPIKNNTKKNNSSNNIVIILIILILIVIVLPVIIGCAVFINNYKRNQKLIDKSFEYFDDVYDEVKNNMDEIKENNNINENTTNTINKTNDNISEETNKIINKTENVIDKVDNFLDEDFFDDNFFDNDSDTRDSSNDSTYSKEDHNYFYENKVGVQAGVLVKNIINNAIKDYSKGIKKVSIDFNGVSYVEPVEMASVVSKIIDKNKYLVICEYDEAGFINKVVISDV